MQRLINTILNEIKCGSVDPIKAGKRTRIYLVDAAINGFSKGKGIVQLVIAI